MTRKLGLMAAALTLAGTALSAQAPDPKLANEGKKLYATYKCDKCHQIAGKGSKKGPLDGVAAKLSAAELRKDAIFAFQPVNSKLDTFCHWGWGFKSERNAW